MGDTFASVAGDLWNELENLRDCWMGTERQFAIEEYIGRYEQLADLAAGEDNPPAPPPSDYVCVPRAALEAFIESAGADHSSVMQEFCVGVREWESAQAEFDALVAALEFSESGAGQPEAPNE